MREKQIEFQQSEKGKTKIKEYNKKHQMHKSHEITEEEWQECKEFFNNSCAYCGISEEKAKKKYKQRLHKEHAINNGSNKIDNCTPACKGCNGSKHSKDWNIWYVPSNPKYKEENAIKIQGWLDKFKNQIDSIGGR